MQRHSPSDFTGLKPHQEKHRSLFESDAPSSRRRACGILSVRRGISLLVTCLSSALKSCHSFIIPAKRHSRENIAGSRRYSAKRKGTGRDEKKTETERRSGERGRSVTSPWKMEIWEGKRVSRVVIVWNRPFRESWHERKGRSVTKGRARRGRIVNFILDNADRSRVLFYYFRSLGEAVRLEACL